MPLDPSVLRRSFELVIDRRPDLTLRFYEILFDRHPELLALFPNNLAVQSRMLGGAIAAVLDHLDDPPWLRTTLSEMGAKHATYGVTPPMYDMVGGALLATLAEAAGDAWTPVFEDQWTEAYVAIVSMMLAGAPPAAA